MFLLQQMKTKKLDFKKPRKNKKKDAQLPLYHSKLTMDVQGGGFSQISCGKVDMSVIEKPQMSDLDALLNLHTPTGGTTSPDEASAATQVKEDEEEEEVRCFVFLFLWF